MTSHRSKLEEKKKLSPHRVMCVLEQNFIVLKQSNGLHTCRYRTCLLSVVSHIEVSLRDVNIDKMYT